MFLSALMKHFEKLIPIINEREKKKLHLASFRELNTQHNSENYQYCFPLAHVYKVV